MYNIITDTKFVLKFCKSYQNYKQHWTKECPYSTFLLRYPAPLEKNNDNLHT